MNRRLRRRGVATVLGSVAMSGLALTLMQPAGAVPLRSLPTDNLDGQVAAAGDDLNEIDAQASAARDKLSAAEGSLPGAQAELASAQSALERAQAAEDAAAAALKEAEAKVTATKTRIDALRGKIEKLKVALASFARQVYTSGGDAGELDILLKSENLGDLTTALESVNTVSRGKNDAVTEFVDAKTKLDTELVTLKDAEAAAQTKRDEAQAAVSEAEASAARASEAKKKVEELVSARSAAVTDLEARRGVVQKKFDELKAAQEAQQAKLAAAEAARLEKLAAAERTRSGQSTASDAGNSQGDSSAPAADPPAQPNADAGSSGGGGATTSGGWTWPTDGSVVGNVGPRINPYTGNAGCHTGVDIGAGMGTPIVAARAGTVIAVEPEDGGPYGNHITIDHGDGLSTMYAHMSSFAASDGQAVTAGQVIGYVGSTGWSTGPHLHFEIHVGGVPYDPMGWFGGGSQSPAC